MRVVCVKCEYHGEWDIMLDRPLSKYDKCKRCFTRLMFVRYACGTSTVRLGANDINKINKINSL